MIQNVGGVVGLNKLDVFLQSLKGLPYTIIHENNYVEIQSPYFTRQPVHIWTWYIFYSMFALHYLATNTRKRQAPQYVAKVYGLWCLSPRLRIHGLPKVLPNHLFVAVHHRMTATPLEFHIMFSFLEQYDEIHVAIGLNTKKLRRYGLGWLPEFTFGAIDLKKYTHSNERHYALVKPMHEAIQAGRSCAVVVFSDIAGSTHFEDRSMIARPGIFAASVCMGLPILDILHFEPMVAEPLVSTVLARFEWPHTYVKGTYETIEAYDEMRHTYQDLIDAWRLHWNSYVLHTIDTFETSFGGCFLHEELGQCDVRNEKEIINNLKRNLDAHIYESKLNYQ